LLTKKNNKSRPPTKEEFLRFKPTRLDFEWNKNGEGLVELKVTKFKGNIGKSFCKILKRENQFIANMDKIGSIAWEKSNGKNTVEDIINVIENEFPDEVNIDQRLILFIQQMGQLGYITY
jgi:hypothetical protein